MDERNEMNADKPSADAQTGRKLLRLRGVRVKPGGVVRMAELLDGWATFPDPGAGLIRVQRISLAILVVTTPIAVIVARTHTSGAIAYFLDLVAFLSFLVVVAFGSTSEDLRDIARWRARRQSTFAVGGSTALRQTLNHVGRTRTVGEMNILLSSIGRADPVYSINRVRHVRVRNYWWHARVDIQLKNDKTLIYRATGIRAPTRLTRIFDDRYPS
jgi:hypothetical protein